ncbi:MAG: translation initiation factor IF-3 [Lachnospiraceae bacterium]|nr:translation initiation factor IF-3 [Lachnospiraceae bacterium]
MFSKQSQALTLRHTASGVHDADFRARREGVVSDDLSCLRRIVFLCQEETAINNNNDLFINEQIRDREVRVIGEDGEQLGVMPIEEALRRAEEAGVDLVKIAPTAKPPVCKIVDYGKYKYDQLRKAKEAKKKQKIVDIKEIRMSPNIDTNDLNTKINAARKFLTKGNRVKFTIRFRGREMAHMGASVHILTGIAEQLSDVAVVEKEPRTEGRFMNMIMAEKR